MSFCVSFFSVAPFAPLLKYTCYMCNRQRAHKSDRISSSLCSHDNALLYLYWYLHFMLIWPWCILSYVWWEAIKLFWINWINWIIPIINLRQCENCLRFIMGILVSTRTTIERLRTDGRTDGRTRWNQNTPFQLCCSWGYNKMVSS